MKSAIDWFEILSKDFSRALRFYSTILGEPLKDMSDQMQCPYAFFPTECPGVGGALRAVGTTKNCNDDGPMIYLNAGEDVTMVLDKVKAAGGEIMMPRRRSENTDSSRSSGTRKGTTSAFTRCTELRGPLLGRRGTVPTSGRTKNRNSLKTRKGSFSNPI